MNPALLSLLSSNPIANCHRPTIDAVLDEDNDDDDDDDMPLQPLPPSCLYDDGAGVVVPVAIGKSNHHDNDEQPHAASSSAAAAMTSRRPRTVILTGNERCQQIDYRDDHYHGDGNDDVDDDDLASTMMILSRLDIEIQGIGRPRNQSKVRQSLEDDYRDMMRRLSAFIATAKRYHQSLQKVQAAKQKMVRSLENLASGYPIADAVFTPSTNTPTTTASIANVVGETTTTNNKTERQTNNSNNKSSSSSGGSCTIAQVWNNADGQALYALKFQKKVIRYCCEWQLEVSSRVARAKKETRSSLSRLTHYLKKVERLRLKSSSSGTVSTLLSSDSWLTLSTTAAKTDPKLDRNLGKLKAAWDDHEVKSTQWSYILEQVTLRGWKELHPLLHNILQLERDRSVAESDRWGQTLPEIENHLDALFDSACKRVTPVMVDYSLDQQRQQRAAASSSGAAAGMAGLSSYGSSDEEWLEEEELEIIEVMLAPRNHYKKELEASSTSPRGIADIEHF